MSERQGEPSPEMVAMDKLYWLVKRMVEVVELGAMLDRHTPLMKEAKELVEKIERE